MHKAWLKERAPKEDAGSGSEGDEGSASASPHAEDKDEDTEEDDEDGTRKMRETWSQLEATMELRKKMLQIMMKSCWVSLVLLL